MAQPTDWGLIIIHGLPDPDHRGQLAAVERLAEQFGSRLASEFGAWFQRTRTGAPHIQNYVLAAYSLGGLGFYSWVVRRQTQRQELRLIRQAILLAAPWRFSRGAVKLQQPSGQWREWTELSPAQIQLNDSSPSQTVDERVPGGIAARLGSRLLLIRSEHDRTIIPYDSAFPTTIAVRQTLIPMPGGHDDSRNTHRELRSDGQAMLVVAASIAQSIVPDLLPALSQ